MKTTLEKLTDKELKSKIDDSYSILKGKLESEGGSENPNNTPLASVINVFNTELNNRSSKRFGFWSTLLIVTSILIQVIGIFCK